MADSHNLANESELDDDGKPKRLGSLDAYRGLAMALMVGEILEFGHVAAHEFKSGFWERFWDVLHFHQSHVAWCGISIHDMIQPSFTFMVGVALPFSLARRQSTGQSMAWVTVHAFWRALLLVFLGIFLRSLHDDHTNFRFDDTLTQIGLGYGFLFVLGQFSKRTHWISLFVILIGYWAAFALYPAPGENFDYAAVGVSQDFQEQHLLEGFESRWNKNANLAFAFEQWWMNLFPRSEEWAYNSGGYVTLNFIPTLATMILGLIAGHIVRSHHDHAKRIGLLVMCGILFLGLGLALDYAGLCPIVKRIWTPSWTLYSGGWCFVILATLYLLIDVVGLKSLFFPLIVVGMNSIAIYCMSWTFQGFVHAAVNRHFGWLLERLPFYEIFETLIVGGLVMLILWLILHWMYRRKIFLRI